MADNVVYDIAGYEAITNAIMILINQYPDLDTGEKITFNSMSEAEGITMYPISGSVVISEKTDVTGYTELKCQYPFMVIYRASGLSESNRIRVKESLDNLGKWLEKQPITIGSEEFKLNSYPSLTEGRKIEEIKRTTPAYLYDQSENRVESWAIAITAEYTHNYKK